MFVFVTLLSSLILALQANQIGYFDSRSPGTKNLDQAKIRQLKQNSGSFVSLDKFSNTISNEVSTNRTNQILQTSLPDNYCLEAFAISDTELNRDPIVEKNTTKILAPASVHKLITAAVALTELGSDSTFDTTLLASKKSTKLSTAYLRTSGDPSFVRSTTPTTRRKANLSPKNVRTFEEFADNTFKTGVRSISNLVVESKWFELDKIEEGWGDEAQLVGQISSLNVDEGFDVENKLASDPLKNAADVLKSVFASKGITIGTVSYSSIPEEINSAGVEISKTSSSKISDLISDMLKTSDNVYAEQILAAVTHLKLGVVNKESEKKLIEESLSRLKIDYSGYVFKNASGYSDEIRTTCKMENSIHLAMLKKGVDLAYLSSQSGKDGTLKDREDDFDETLFAKTGTLDNVTALSGRIGEDILFTFIANSKFSNEEGQQFQSNVVNVLSRYPYVQNPDF